MVNTCGKNQVLYGILAIVIGYFALSFGSRTMAIYTINKVETFKYLSIAVLTFGTLAIAYGILSFIFINNPHFCALTTS